MHIVFGITLLLVSTSAAASDPLSTAEKLDLLWIILSLMLVFFMQAGFTLLETGSIRAKNSINVAIKNVSDLILTIVVFLLFGFALMFGATQGGWFGFSGFFLKDVTSSFDISFFLFQAVFAGTAATIFSGAVAERMSFIGYLIATLFLTGLIYPISGHWAWGGMWLGADEAGWLAARGFVDFAGSTVVHLSGAVIGLAAIIVLGPRIGRFDKNGIAREIPGNNLALAAIGVIVLWFGWFGFNAGSELALSDNVPKILLNTMVAPAVSGIAVFILSLLFARGIVINVGDVLNGILAGLVGITAGCAYVDVTGATWIGIGSALAYLLAHRGLIAMKLDDPVSVVSVHGAAGIWGTLAVALFAPLASLPTDSRLEQLLTQSLGVVSISIWAFVIGLVIFTVLNYLGVLRVPPDDEIKGLNVSEHGAKTVWLDTANAMQRVIATRDFSERVPVENGTEAGVVAEMFNRLMGEMEEMIGALRRNQDQMSNVVNQVANVSSELGQAIDDLSIQMNEISSAAENTADSKERVRETTQNGATAIGAVNDQMATIDDGMQSMASVTDSLLAHTGEIQSVVEFVQELSFQSQLLGINAAVEAAHAGEHGSGFAVVASEIRALAQKSLHSGEQIVALINEIQQLIQQAVAAAEGGKVAVHDGTDAVRTMDSSFQNIHKTIEQDSVLNSRINSAVQEQNRTRDNISRSFTALSQLSHDLQSAMKQLATSGPGGSQNSFHSPEPTSRSNNSWTKNIEANPSQLH